MVYAAYMDHLFANGSLEAEVREPLASWPEPLTETERAVPWVNLRAKREADQHPMFWPQAWSLDFSNFTPKRLEKQG